MSGEDHSLEELRKISKILTLAHASVLEVELGKIASSDVRKKMWVLINGISMPKDIADKLKITDRAVNYFLDSLEKAGFIENRGGRREPPKKVLDYVPPSWIELAMPEDKQQTGEPSTESSSEVPS